MATVDAKTMFERLRMPLTWGILPAWLAFAVTTKASGFQTVPYEMIEMAGFLLIFAAALGRLWCSLYIAGRKDRELCTSGPYSLSRNPLYFFSLVGLVGVCLVAQNILLAVISVGGSAAFYAKVVRQEERRLELLFGDEFRDYAQETPRFFPLIESPRTEEKILVSAKAFVRALADAGWFLMAIVGLELLEALHETGALAVWTLPI